jgi:hypothetical protein
MNKHLLSRREFNRLCVALGSSLSLVGPTIVALSSAPARAATRNVKFRDGTIVPALGRGSANLGQGRHPEPAEEEALRTGLSLGMTLIDTAEMYGNGRSEKLIGRAIAGQRDRVFLVSKVWPNHVTGDGIARACEASLGRFGTNYQSLPAALANSGCQPLQHRGGIRKSTRGREDPRLGRVQLQGQ